MSSPFVCDDCAAEDEEIIRGMVDYALSENCCDCGDLLCETAGDVILRIPMVGTPIMRGVLERRFPNLSESFTVPGYWVIAIDRSSRLIRMSDDPTLKDLEAYENDPAYAQGPFRWDSERKIFVHHVVVPGGQPQEDDDDESDVEEE